MTGAHAMLWPAGIVPYAIAKALKPEERLLIADVLAEISARSRVRFRLRDTEHDRITFRIDGAPHSALGRAGGDQTVSLVRPLQRGEILHEVLHALGLRHEHTRPNRGEFVAIHLEHALDEGAKRLLSAIEERPDDRPYDYASVMHYPADAFAKPGQKTIVPLKPIPTGLVLGVVDKLSAGDVESLRLLYG